MNPTAEANGGNRGLDDGWPQQTEEHHFEDGPSARPDAIGLVRRTVSIGASARLACWSQWIDAEPRLLDWITRALRFCSAAQLISESHDLSDRVEPDVRALTAILDKLITRGNPTLADDWLEAEILRANEFAQAPDKAFALNLISTFADLSAGLIDAKLAAPLSGLSKVERGAPTPSYEENLFDDAFRRVMGEAAWGLLRRQVRFDDLIESADRALSGNYVDFCFPLSVGAQFIIEIDGEQHRNDRAQEQHDAKRDQLFKSQGWATLRFTAAEVRANADDCVKRLLGSLRPRDHDRLKRVALGEASAPIHQQAFRLIAIPAAVQQVQRAIVRLVRARVLKVNQRWRILAVEHDVPCIALAFECLLRTWNALFEAGGTLLPPPEVEVLTRTLQVVTADRFVHTRVVAAHDSRQMPPIDAVLVHAWSPSMFATDTDGIIKDRRESAHVFWIRRIPGGDFAPPLLESPTVAYDLEELERCLRETRKIAPESKAATQAEALERLLRIVFRKEQFREGQMLAICRLLQGKDTVVLLPTGGGKSLIYQFSSLLLPGASLVVDPLVSLMRDQVQNLQAIAIDRVVSISSLDDGPSREATEERMRRGAYLFILVSPERLQIASFRSRLGDLARTKRVNLGVVDEAHCVSEWGHDFRTSYLGLARTIRRVCAASGTPPALAALTGTASFAVLTDIQIELEIDSSDAIIEPRSFDRPELVFNVVRTRNHERLKSIKEAKESLPGELALQPEDCFALKGSQTNCGLIFVPHVDGDLGVDAVADKVGHKHVFAGKCPKSRPHKEWDQLKQTTQDSYKSNLVQEIVATKSFGMGIDKPNIRYTIHGCMPMSVEAFYQEAGRAGRNRIPNYARCILVYSDDGWASGQTILRETDHSIARQRLDGVRRQEKGDLLVQLWFLLNSYRSQDEEILELLDLWEVEIAPYTRALSADDHVHLDIPFGQTHEKREKCIHRLRLLGVVADYTVNWHKRIFTAQCGSPTSTHIAASLRTYICRYKLEPIADEIIADIKKREVHDTLKAAADKLVRFIYDEIVAKRKQALRTMGEICRSFTSDQAFRTAILDYLQESDFSKDLKTWVGQSFETIGLPAVRKLLERVTNAEEGRKLVGSTRRMLDEDPSNLALRLTSIVSRARSESESVASMADELDLFLGQTLRLWEKNPSLAAETAVYAVKEIARRDTGLSERAMRDLIDAEGKRDFVRTWLVEDDGKSLPSLREQALAALVGCVTQATRTITAT